MLVIQGQLGFRSKPWPRLPTLEFTIGAASALPCQGLTVSTRGGHWLEPASNRITESWLLIKTECYRWSDDHDSRSGISKAVKQTRCSRVGGGGLFHRAATVGRTHLIIQQLEMQSYCRFDARVSVLLKVNLGGGIALFTPFFAAF